MKVVLYYNFRYDYEGILLKEVTSSCPYAFDFSDFDSGGLIKDDYAQTIVYNPTEEKGFRCHTFLVGDNSSRHRAYGRLDSVEGLDNIIDFFEAKDCHFEIQIRRSYVFFNLYNESDKILYYISRELREHVCSDMRRNFFELYSMSELLKNCMEKLVFVYAKENKPKPCEGLCKYIGMPVKGLEQNAIYGYRTKLEKFYNIDFVYLYDTANLYLLPVELVSFGSK